MPFSRREKRRNTRDWIFRLLFTPCFRMIRLQRKPPGLLSSSVYRFILPEEAITEAKDRDTGNQHCQHADAAG